MAKLSDEQINEIIERYEAGEPMHAICKDYGVDFRTGHYWYNKRVKGVSHYEQRIKASKKKTVCHKCGHTDHSGKAMYCCMCGTKFKSSADFLMDDLNYIADMTQFFPASTRDKVIATVNKAIDYIKRTEKERKENGINL